MHEVVAFKPAAARAWSLLLIFYRILVHNAWIGTLGLIVTAIALLYFGQSRDLLWGIGEPVLFNLPGPTLGWSNVTPYGSFWLGTVILATTLALVVRTTGAGGFSTLQGGVEPGATKNVAYCARIVLVAALTIMHFAFLRQLTGNAVNAIASLLVMAAVLTVPWILVTIQQGNRGVGQHLVAGVLVAIFLFGVWATARELRGQYIRSLSAVTPSLAFLTTLTFGSCQPLSERTWLIVLGISFALLSCAVFWPWSPSVFWTIGSLPIALIWLAWVICTLACLAITLRRSPKAIGLDLIAGGLLVVWLVSKPSERFGQESFEPTALASKNLQTAGDLKIARDESTASTANGTQFVINADGGGLRAAMFTAEVLAIADDMTCGDFGAHVFAASGVSGGSLGIATWAVMRQEFVQGSVAKGQPAWDECKKSGRQYASTDASPDPSTPLRNRVYGVLAQDHLSATLASMLAHDIWPWGHAERGQALLDSWQTAAQDVLLQYGDSSSRQGGAFATLLKDVTAGLPRPPKLMFTATDIVSGNRVVFSNSEGISSADFGALPIGLAALNSARFPLISPAGLVRIGDKSIRVVDGGYFDNSGAASLIEALTKAKAKNDKELTSNAIAVRIEGNTPDGGSLACGQFFEKLIKDGQYPRDFKMPPQWTGRPAPEEEGWSGLDAAMAARSAQADETAAAVSRLPFISSTVRLQLDYYAGFIPQCPGDGRSDCVTLNISACFNGLLGRRAPLGWYLSANAATNVDRSAWDAATQLVKLLPSASDGR